MAYSFSNLVSPFTNLFKKPTFGGSQRASLVNPAGAFSQAPQISIPKPNRTASPFGFASPQIPPAIPGVNFTPYRPPGYAPNITSAITKKPAYATPSGAIIDPTTGQLISPPPTPANFTPYRPPSTQLPQGTTQINQNLPQGASSAVPPPVLPPPPQLPPETPPEATEPQPQPEPDRGPVPLTKQEEAVAAAEKLYQEASQINPEELSTQEDVDKLIEQARKIQQSFRLGYQNIQEQPIAMEFITGQQRSLENRLANTLTGLGATAEPLEQKLARMQAKRTAALEASKFGLTRADTALSTTQAQAQKQREEAESARRFGVEQAGAAETRGLAKTKVEQDKATTDRQFEEDKRQFGLDYAIKQREAAVKELEVSQKGETTGITPAIGSALQVVNDLLPRVSSIAGVFRTGALTGDKAKLDQLISQLSLNARGLIKGSGAISDFEAQTLEKSASALSGSRLSENFIDQELRKIRGTLNANAGLSVQVRVTDPQSGQTKDGSLDRNAIFDAASQGYQIEYL